MTPGHKHRYVKVTEGSLVYRLLKKEILVSRNEQRVDNSLLVWGQPDVKVKRFVLTPLSILHTFTGLTFRTHPAKPKTYGCDVCGQQHLPGFRHG